MSAISSQQRYHPPYLRISDIVLYFMFRIESSDHDEQRLFISTFCQHFTHRIDQHLQHQHPEPSPSKQKHPDPSLPSSDCHHPLKNGLHGSRSRTYSLNKTKDVFYGDEDVYNVVLYAPLHLVLSLFIPHILQNRFLCPLKAVWVPFANLITYINQKLDSDLPHSAPPYPLSAFLEKSLTDGIQFPYQMSVDSPRDDEESTGICTDEQWFRCYGQFGRISHLNALLSVHPEYYDDLNNLMHCLMFESNGPLALSSRQYLGLMAASRYDGCNPVISQCEMQYAKLNGDPTWIKTGVTSAPHKYQKLARINALLAHRPWDITVHHIAELLKGDGSWTVSELVQALVILVQYHFLAAMYQGLCITPEIDHYYASKLVHHDLLNDGNGDGRGDGHEQMEDDSALSSALAALRSPVATAADPDIYDVAPSSGSISQRDTDHLAVDLDSFSLNSSPITKRAAVMNDDEDLKTSVDEIEQEECLRRDAIATLLRHKLQTDDDTENAKDGWANAACMHRELDSASVVNLADGVKVSLKLRQISSSIEEDEDDSPCGSMECDPEMAPPKPAPSTLSVTSPLALDALNEDDPEHKANEDDSTMMSSKHLPPPKVQDMTSAHWMQLVAARRKGMIPSKSTESLISVKESQKKAVDDTESKPVADSDDVVSHDLVDTAKMSSDHVVEPKAKSTAKKGRKRKAKPIEGPTSGGTMYWRYSLDIDMVYTDYQINNDPVIRFYEFDWENHGYSCLSRYYPGIEKKVDAVFRRAQTMTDGCVNGVECNTDVFRSAMRHYAFRLYGINNDAYDYGDVNKFLYIRFKTFIKKLVCYPHLVTYDDVRHCGIRLGDQERVHVAILVLEAKKQAALLWALRAVMRFMQSN